MARSQAFQGAAAAPKVPPAGKRKRDELKPVVAAPAPVQMMTDEEKQALVGVLEHVVPPEELLEFLQSQGVALVSGDVSAASRVG